jgi:hypothetical protein
MPIYIAERVGPRDYIARSLFVTNKFLNMTARSVDRFDPGNPGNSRYEVGTGALLAWGRPGFESDDMGGAAPPYFFHHPLPFERDGERIVFEPRFLSAIEDGAPQFTSSQAEAQPLLPYDNDPPNQTAVSYVPPLERWAMIYGGDLPELMDPEGAYPPHAPPVARAIHGRLAPHPWGPWSDSAPILTEEAMAAHLICGPDAKPAGCLAAEARATRPDCIELLNPLPRGLLYGAGIIDALTRPVPLREGEAAAANVYWNVSTWNPYAVALVKTRISRQQGAEKVQRTFSASDSAK